MNKEVWKDMPGYENLYQVSDFGRVKYLERIILNKGKYPYLSKEKILKLTLNNCGYLNVNLSKNSFRKIFNVHQLVAIAFLNHKPDGHKLVVDHINNDKLDNRLENLRIVTNRENTNKKHIPSSSQCVGVSWYKINKKWKAGITINGKSKNLGYFTTEIEASNAYKQALLTLKQL